MGDDHHDDDHDDDHDDVDLYPFQAVTIPVCLGCYKPSDGRCQLF